MDGLPVRGPEVRQLGLVLPPERMPLLRGGRALKRWRYVGVYGPDLMLCVGEARVGPLPMRWWAVALPDGTLHERTTTRRAGVSLAHGRVQAPGISLDLEEDDGVEVASPDGGSYLWTRKQGDAQARGTVEIGGARHEVDGVAIVDDTAGYHRRQTEWRWSAGVGRSSAGERVAWNLVTGVHDAAESSERTVWVDGAPVEVEQVDFADDLSRVGDVSFSEWSAREDHTNLLLFRSDYRQPFGTFRGRLPGGVELAEGYGVMEEHDVRW